MNDEIRDIIRRLERQEKAIETALSALRALDNPQTAETSAKSAVRGTKASPRRRGTLTDEGRRRLSEAMRARWAAKRSAGGKRSGRRGV